MNNQFVPIQKMSKKIKREYYREKHGNWVNINPCTKVIDDKTKYGRNRFKSIDYSRFA